MACGCNKTAAAPRAFAFVSAEGQRTEKPTEVEALAMKIRAGNTGTVEPVK